MVVLVDGTNSFDLFCAITYVEPPLEMAHSEMASSATRNVACAICERFQFSKTGLAPAIQGGPQVKERIGSHPGFG